ncbi:MAG: response regulator, partial [Desulfomonilaceae bacterium]|nr:response regulator [Desulfomonilaceae bacterium]
GGASGTIIGIVIVLFAVVLLLTGRRLHKANEDSLRLRSEKDGLVESLWSQKTVVEDLNRSLQSEIAERIRSEDSLRESETRYRTLVETARDVIWTTDPDLRYTYVSPSVSDMLGYTAEEITAMSLPDTVASESRERLLRSLREEMDRDAGTPRRRTKAVTEEIEQYHKDGSIRIVEMTVSFLRDASGEVTGILGISRDISERRKAAAQLERALATATKLRSQAEAANLAKSEFLANVSHELRTPLNAIIGFSEILIDKVFGELNDKQLRHINHVLNSGHHLLQLINEILDLSKVESGKMELRPARTDVVRLLENALLMIRETALKKRLTTSLVVGNELAKTYVNLDQIKFKQIMFNLLSNAAKFTPAGGSIEIIADLKDKTLLVSIRDTGIGIRPADREIIFHTFRQVDSSYARLQPGTGLGLTLTRRLVELHGGTIRVESEGEGRGSTFAFSIPVTVEEIDEQGMGAGGASADAAPTKSQGLESHCHKILVVEDDPATSEIIAHHLSEAGYAVVRVSDGNQAIKAARQGDFLAITLDVIMPRRDGIDTLIELKRSPETKGIPVVLVTIYDDRKLALALGAAELIVKPVDKEQLLAILRRLEAEKARKGITIMVVDDDPSDVEYLSGLLSSKGYGVIPALGGKQVLKLAETRRPDVIVLNLLMPDPTGFEVAELLRGTPATSRTPIIVYTAMDLSEEDEARLRNQVQGIALKSGAGEELLKQLDGLNAAGCSM